MKALKIIRNWFLFFLILGIIIAPFWVWRPNTWHWPSLPAMTGLQAVVNGFAVAFMWVEVLKMGRHKPFNCLKCMCGWFTFFIALAFHVQFWYFYLPVGLMVGAIYSAIKMRYL